MRNVNSERVLFIPRIYSSLSEGCRNEDFGYALLLLAVEVVSFILDLKGGSQWGYLLASFLLSVLILETTIYAYFIKRSTINSEAYATIAVVFTFKSKKDVSHSSSNTPSNQVGIVGGTGESELESIRVDPLDRMLVSVPAIDADVDPPNPMLVSVPAIDADVDPPNPMLVSVPASDANVESPDPKFVSVPASDANFDLQDPTFVSVPASDANVDPPDPTSVSVPASYANVDPPDPTSVSVPAGDAKVDPRDPKPVSVPPASDVNVDPPDSMLVPVPASDVNVPQAKMLRQRNKQTQLSSVHVKKLVFKVDLPNHKARIRAMKTVSRISGVDSIEMEKTGKSLTVMGDVDPIDVVSKLRKQCYNDIISVGPAKQPKTSKKKQSVVTKD